jgi:hypothetical protein
MMSQRLLSKQQKQVYTGWPQQPFASLLVIDQRKVQSLKASGQGGQHRQALGCWQAPDHEPVITSSFRHVLLPSIAHARLVVSRVDSMHVPEHVFESHSGGKKVFLERWCVRSLLLPRKRARFISWHEEPWKEVTVVDATHVGSMGGYIGSYPPMELSVLFCERVL